MSGESQVWEEVELFRALLRMLHDRETHGESPAGSIGDMREQLMGRRYWKLEDRALDDSLPSMEKKKGSFAERRNFLYLNIVREGTPILPLLDVWWDFEARPPEISLRLMLFLRDGDRLRSIGFRFESGHAVRHSDRERRGGRSRRQRAREMHSYPHAQLLKTLESPGDRHPFEPETPQREQAGSYIPWLPERQPALPLPTSSSVGLLLCLLLSLYGPAYLKEIQRGLSGDPRRAHGLRRECAKIVPSIELG